MNDYSADISLHLNYRCSHPTMPVEVFWFNPQPGTRIIAPVHLSLIPLI
jgi:hypothetical protein